MANRDEPRCLACTRDLQLMWTPEAVVLAIQEWADEHGGIPPTATDWNPAHAIAHGRPEAATKFYADRRWPHVSSVQRALGAWATAIAVAGFEAYRPGRYGRGGEDAEVVQHTVDLYRSGLSLVDVAKALGDVGPSAVGYRLKKAGEPRRPASVKGTRRSRAM